MGRKANRMNQLNDFPSEIFFLYSISLKYGEKVKIKGLTFYSGFDLQYYVFVFYIILYSIIFDGVYFTNVCEVSLCEKHTFGFFAWFNFKSRHNFS